jgi:hypothetical protein
VVPGVVQPALHTVNPGSDSAFGLFRTGKQDAGAEKLKVEPGRRGAGHLGQGCVGNVRRAREFRGPEIMCLVLEPCDLVRRHAAQDYLGAFGHGLDDDEIAEAFQQIFDKTAGIVAGLDDTVHCLENSCGIGGSHGFHHVIEQ